jgi:hypothetical protein
METQRKKIIPFKEGKKWEKKKLMRPFSYQYPVGAQSIMYIVCSVSVAKMSTTPMPQNTTHSFWAYLPLEYTCLNMQIKSTSNQTLKRERDM